MKKYLVTTIDVEPDCSPSWHYANPLSFKGVSVGIAGKLQPLFNKYHIIPTYLINNVVLEDERSGQILKQLSGKYELGTHLHPEFILPDKRFTEYAGKKGEGNCCFYPPDIEYEKIKNITDLFSGVFGRKPTSFRAGRYSAGTNTMNSLCRLGYLVDTSITPHLYWNDPSREKPVDFRTAPEQPYFMNRENILLKDGEGELLQVHISIVSKKRNLFREILVSGAGLIRPIQKRKNIWLRPFYSSSRELIGIAGQYISTYSDQPFVVLNMMFHNVEVLPGLSPYCQSEKECREYLQQLEVFFAFCLKEEIKSVALSELYDLIKRK
jgi:hypothetical protein